MPVVLTNITLEKLGMAVAMEQHTSAYRLFSINFPGGILIMTNSQASKKLDGIDTSVEASQQITSHPFTESCCCFSNERVIPLISNPFEAKKLARGIPNQPNPTNAHFIF